MIENPRKFNLGELEVWENGEIFKVQNGEKTKYEPTKYKSRYKHRLLASYSEDGEQKNVNIAREIANHFVPNPDNKPLVSFKDGDATNISADNLVWIDHKERFKLSQLTRDSNKITCGVCGKKYDATREFCPNCLAEKKRLAAIEKNKIKKINRIKEKFNDVDKERLSEEWLAILEERLKGKTLQEIGDERNVTREYIRQILKNIENGEVKLKKTNKKSLIERIDWIDDKISHYQLEKEKLEKKLNKED